MVAVLLLNTAQKKVIHNTPYIPEWSEDMVQAEQSWRFPFQPLTSQWLTYDYWGGRMDAENLSN